MKNCRTNTLRTTKVIGILLLFLGYHIPSSIHAQSQALLASETLSVTSYSPPNSKETDKEKGKKSKLEAYTEQLTNQNKVLRARFQALTYESKQWRTNAVSPNSMKQNHIDVHVKYAQLIDELQQHLADAYEIYEDAKQKGKRYKSELAHLGKELEVILAILEASKAEFNYFKDKATTLERSLLFSKIELKEARQQVSEQGTTIFVNETQAYHKLRNKTISRKEKIIIETTYYIPADKFGGDFKTTVPATFYLIKPDGTELKQSFNLKIKSKEEATKVMNFADKPVYFLPLQKGVILKGKRTINLGKLLSKKDFKHKKQGFSYRIEINQDILLHGKLRLKR